MLGQYQHHTLQTDQIFNEHWTYNIHNIPFTQSARSPHVATHIWIIYDIIYDDNIYIVYMIWSYCDHHVISSSPCRELYDTEKYSISTFGTIIRLPLPTTCPLQPSGTLRISTGTAQLWTMDCPGVRKPSRWHYAEWSCGKTLADLTGLGCFGQFLDSTTTRSFAGMIVWIYTGCSKVN